MKRAIKKVTIVLFAVLLLLAGVISWILNDDGFVKTQAESFFEKTTGRALNVASLEIDWGRLTYIRARNVSLANESWGEADHLAEIANFEIEIVLSSLFKRRLDFTHAVIEQATLNFQEDESGRNNWTFSQDEEPTSKREGPLPLSWESLSVSDFRLSHVSPERDVPLDFLIQEFMAMRDIQGRVDVNGAGLVGGYDLSINGFLDPMSSLAIGGPMSHDLSVQLGSNLLETSGTVEDAVTGAGADIDMRFRGPEFRWLLEQAALPIFSEGPFDMTMALSLADDQTVNLDLDGDLGTMRATADGQLDHLVNPDNFEFAFNVEGPDLRSLGMVFDVEQLPQSPYEVSGRTRLRDDMLKLDPIELEVGSDKLLVSGDVGAWPGLKGTSLDVSITGENFGHWGMALGLSEWKSVPFNLTGKFFESSGRLAMDGSRFTLGANSIEVSGYLNTDADFLGSRLQVGVEIPDLSTVAQLDEFGLTRGLPLVINSVLERVDRGIGISNTEIVSGPHRVSLEGLLSLPAEDGSSENEDWRVRFDNSQLEAIISTPSAKLFSETFQLGPAPDLPVNVDLSVALQEGGLNYRLDLDGPENIRITFEGRVPRPFMGDGVTGVLDAEFNTLRFLESFGQIPPLPDLPVTVDGSLLVTPETMDLTDISGTLGQASYELSGQIGRFPNIQLRNFRFSVTGPDWNTFYQAEMLQGLPPGFAMSGAIDFLDDAQLIETLSLVLGESSVQLTGTVDDLVDPGDFDLAVNVEVKEMAEFEPFISRFTKIAVPPGPLNAEFNVVGSPDQFELTGIRSGFNESELDGHLEVSLVDIPTFRGRVNAEHIDLSWLVDLDEKADAESSQGAVGEPESRNKNSGRVFGDHPLRLFDYDPIIVDVDFHSDSLILDSIELSKVDVSVRLTETSLDLSPVRLADTTGREFSLELNLLEEEGKVKASVDGLATGLRLGLTATEDDDISTLPPSDFFVNLDAIGATPHELINSTVGEIEIILGEGRISNSRLSLLASDLVTEIFTRLNPFAQGSDFTQVDCGVARVSFNSGTAEISPFVFQTDSVVIVSSGEVKLDTEAVNIGFRTRPRRGLGLSASAIVNPFIRVGGTLSDPGLVLNPTDAAIMSSAAVATGGLSILGTSLFDRFLRERDPCGRIVEEKRQSAAAETAEE